MLPTPTTPTLLEPVDVALRRGEPMRRVRGVVHGPAWGLSAPQKGGRPAREATLYRAATPRPFLLPLFTQLRGVRILRTSQVRSSRKLTTAFVTMFESV